MVKRRDYPAGALAGCTGFGAGENRLDARVAYTEFLGDAGDRQPVGFDPVDVVVV